MNWRTLGASRRRHGLTPLTAFLVVFALAFVSLATWSLSDPLVSAPDEQSHIMTAYALDHGSLVEPTVPASNVSVDVTVPASIAYTAVYPDCWHFHPTIAADCSLSWPHSQTPTIASIYTQHYPPLYYSIVGLATFVSDTPNGIYLMRIVSDVLGATMLAVSAFALRSWGKRRSLWLGVYASLTPIAYFLSSSVNPGGFEIMSAISFWTLIAIWGLDYADAPPRGLVVLLGVVATTLVLIRGMSPVWVALGGATLITLVGPVKLWQKLLVRRDFQVMAGTVLASTLLAVGWIFSQGTLNILPVGQSVPKTDSLVQVLHIVLRFVKTWLRESVGILGWLDTTLPMRVYDVWYLIIGALIVTALVRGSWRQRIIVIGLAGLTFAIPVVIVTLHAKTFGVVWQGRDSLPLGVGAIVMASGVCSRPRSRSPLGRYVLVGAIGVLALADMLSFYTNLRRYSVGRYGPASFFLHTQGWSPPIGRFGALAAYGVVTTLLAGLLAAWVWLSSGISSDR